MDIIENTNKEIPIETEKVSVETNKRVAKELVSKKYKVIAIKQTFVVLSNENNELISIPSVGSYKIGDIIEL